MFFSNSAKELFGRLKLYFLTRGMKTVLKHKYGKLLANLFIGNIYPDIFLSHLLNY